MKKLSLILFLVLPFYTFSQTVTYYPFNSILSVSSNPTRTVWVDARFQMNSYFSSLSTEFAPMVNLNDNDKGRFYVGAGARFNFVGLIEDYQAKVLEGYSLHVGVRSAPIEKYPRLQFAFEVSPYVQKNFEIGLFRSALGVGYVFGR